MPSRLLVLSLVPAGMLLLTLAGHRCSDFSLLLRWVVSGGTALLALVAHDQDASGWMWVMVGLLILFNPLVPLHLRRDRWRMLDPLAAGILVAAALSLQASSHSRGGGTAA